MNRTGTANALHCYVRLATCSATDDERRRPLPADTIIPRPLLTSTHAITIDAPPEQVWPWLAQMGSGRAGWYSWDAIDNGARPSATRIVPELQAVAAGDVMPAVPGARDAFVVAAVDPPRDLVLTVADGSGTPAVAWEHVLERLEGDRTRLIVRAQVSSRWIDLARAGPPAGRPRFFIERAYALLARLPRPLLVAFGTLGHRIMEARHLRGIERRSAAAARSAARRPRSAFKTPEGEALFLAAYDAAMKLWPVPYEEMEIPTQFGMTHVVVSGPKDARPLVLLHGYMATSTMWSPNIADFSKDYRVYAIDVMGQPGKSIPEEPIRNAADYAAWLAATLDGLHLDRVSLVGMSYGGWLALNFAVAAPGRLQRLVLLSPGGGFVPMARQFSLRGMLMSWLTTRFTVNSFMRWLGFKNRPGDTEARLVFDLMYRGLKHFRVPVETLRVMPVMFPDDQLRAMRVPTLLLIGDHEVICDPAHALTRARRLFPDVQGELVPRSSHDMCFSQHRIVDARVLAFLKNMPDSARRDEGQPASTRRRSRG